MAMKYSRLQQKPGNPLRPFRRKFIEEGPFTKLKNISEML